MNKQRIVKYAFITVLQFASCAMMAQTAAIPAKFKTYSDKAIQEKLFIHSDKELYVAGDILWFKIYYVEGTKLEPLNLSKLAYVEVINSNNEPVQQGKIALEKGTGVGSFYLPAALPTGNYTLRAYTNWMKNFDVSLFFEKKITIINTLKAPDASSAKDSSVVVADFFPEGGNLVNGLTSKVGFQVYTNKGSLNECRGVIINENNDSVASFVPLKFGLGSFYFTPQEGHTYRAVIILPDGSITNRRIPQIFSAGYVMNVTDAGNQKIKITVSAKGSQQNTEELFMLYDAWETLNMTQLEYLELLNDALKMQVELERILEVK